MDELGFTEVNGARGREHFSCSPKCLPSRAAVQKSCRYPCSPRDHLESIESEVVRNMARGELLWLDLHVFCGVRSRSAHAIVGDRVAPEENGFCYVLHHHRYGRCSNSCVQSQDANGAISDGFGQNVLVPVSRKIPCSPSPSPLAGTD